ncbi:MAG: 2-amino-4-hydroxy-6-hydroxymethyldihydropteridine diphosphokinase [Armatimonadota bacterium]|nr:2-amino-4-hydroxy-6-hydroxymethyldihydropteridine diphosphokinase [Armatimonadota bacterium]
MTGIYLGLGSNLGRREATLAAALDALDAAGVRIVRRSPVYETEPVGLSEQPWFLNMVVEVETALDPEALLDLIQRVEVSLGRTRDRRWGPRTIDIDLLLYQDRIISTPRLVVPHPELIRRRFVLEPLAALQPDLVLPDGTAIAAALAALDPTPVVRRVAEGMS